MNTIFTLFVQWVLKHRILVLLLAAGIFFVGVYVALTTPLDILPDLNRPTVTIFAEAPGMATEEVESLVSMPIESAMNGAAKVERVRSVSALGLALIFVEFDWNQDIYQSRQIVTEKLSSVSLPEGVDTRLGPVSSIMGEIQLIGISSKKGTTTPAELRQIADWTVRPRLLTINGISQVTNIGGDLKEYQIRIDPVRLSNYQLSIKEVTEKIQGTTTNKSGGFLSTDDKEYPVRIIGNTTDIEVLEDTVIGRHENTLIYLKDIATIVLGKPQSPRGDASINAKRGVIMSITKQPGANTLELTESVHTTLQELQASLGEDIEIHPDLFKQEKFIKNGIRNVIDATRDASILVIIILILFLGNIRALGITLTALPFSFAISILILRMFNVDINVMTLGGLAVAVGELTDDAIVDVENIIRWMKENKKNGSKLSTLECVLHGSSEVRGSIIFSTIIVVLVFLPMLALGNIEGKLLAPLALAYITSLIASTIVAMTITVVLSYYFLPKSKLIQKDHETWLVRKVKDMVRPVLRLSIRFPYVSALICVVSLVISGSMFMSAGKEFLPPFNEGTLTIGATLAPGASLELSNDVGRKIEETLLTIPGVKSVARRTGRAEEDEHANSVNVSELEVDIEEREKDRIIEEIQKALAQKDLNNASVSIGQPISHRIEHILSGVRAPLVVKVFGPDLGELKRYAEEIKAMMADIPGTLNPNVEQEVLTSQISIIPNRERSAQYGFVFDSLTETISTLFAGETIGKIIDQDKIYNLVIQIDKAFLTDPQSMGSIVLKGNNNVGIPLSSLADITTKEGNNSISHDNGKRRIVISSGIQDGDSVTIIETLKTKIAQTLTLDREYSISYEGTYKSQQESSMRLLVLSLLACIGVMIVLYINFRSIRLVLQVVSVVPVAYLGAMIGVLLTGNVISLASLIGLISLLGLGSRNGLLLIEHWKFLAMEEKRPVDHELIIQGSLNRIIPMLMTSLSASLALIPLLLAANEPGKELLYPLSVVIFSGLISTTVVEILLRPGLFELFGKKALIRKVTSTRAITDRELTTVQDVSS